MAEIKKKIYSLEEQEKLRNEIFSIGTEDVSKNLFYSIKSRYKLIYIVSSEEQRIISLIKNFCISETYSGFTWDCSRGLLDVFSQEPVTTTEEDIKDEEAILSYIIDTVQKGRDQSSGRIYLLLDYHKFLENDDSPRIERKLKEFAHCSECDTIVIVAPEYVKTSTLDKEFTMIDFPYPSKKEVQDLLELMKSKVVTTHPDIAKEADKKKESLIQTVAGLTLREAKDALSKTMVKDKGFKISTLLREKELIIKKSGLLEICESDFSMDDVGGLETLKEWLKVRKLAFSEDAKDFGLPPCRGSMLVGIPGTGKSLCCKAVASFYEMPLLRLDLGSMFGSRVGESEKRMRDCLKCVQSSSPCVLWLDEIEKGLSGAASSGHTDGGTTARVVSTLLTWMQEKKENIFVMATANNINDIPPEFMRAGRFDEIFFLDLPSEEERCDIVNKLIRRKKRNPENFDCQMIAKWCETYTGAEIEKAIDNALFTCFYEDKREMTTEDVCHAFSQFVPLYKSRKAEIDGIREWAKNGGALIANAALPKKTEKKKNKKTEMALDFS